VTLGRDGTGASGGRQAGRYTFSIYKRPVSEVSALSVRIRQNSSRPVQTGHLLDVADSQRSSAFFAVFRFFGIGDER
jgi:hypothetical protein